MGWWRRCRTGRDTKAPGSIPAGGKQVREATRMSVLAVTIRQSPAVLLACYPLDGPELTGGKDDRVFRLDRVNDAACAGMKR